MARVTDSDVIASFFWQFLRRFVFHAKLSERFFCFFLFFVVFFCFFVFFLLFFVFLFCFVFFFVCFYFVFCFFCFCFVFVFFVFFCFFIFLFCSFLSIPLSQTFHSCWFQVQISDIFIIFKFMVSQLIFVFHYNYFIYFIFFIFINFSFLFFVCCPVLSFTFFFGFKKT